MFIPCALRWEKLVSERMGRLRASPLLRSPLRVSLSDTELVTPAGTRSVSEACGYGVGILHVTVLH